MNQSTSNLQNRSRTVSAANAKARPRASAGERSDSPADHLCAILEQEFLLHQELFIAAQAMNKALREDNTAGVSAASSKYDDLTVRLEALEEGRLEACDILAAQLKCGRSHVTVSQLISLLPPIESAKLAAIRDKLKARVQELMSMNVSNRIFLEEGILSITNIFEIIRSNAASRTAGYKPFGTRSGSALSTPIINQTA